MVALRGTEIVRVPLDEALADRWSLDDELEAIGERWDIAPGDLQPA